MQVENYKLCGVFMATLMLHFITWSQKNQIASRIKLHLAKMHMICHLEKLSWGNNDVI
jgi:hypothetical protein